MTESIDAQLEGSWYIAVSGGQADGPLRTEVVKQRLHEGTYAARQLAWRQGMTDWLPIGSISDFGNATTSGSARSLTWMPAGLLGPPAEFMLLFVVGRTALGLALVTLVISLLAWLWGRSWFEQAYLLILIFAICEGQAGIWKALSKRPLPPPRGPDSEPLKA